MHYEKVSEMISDAKVSIEDYGNFALGKNDDCVIEIYNWGEIIILNEFEFAYNMLRYDIRELEPLC